MGDDGARGLKEMHEAGAYTLAQDEKSSVVWGMPGEAVKQGGVDEIVDINDVAAAILRAVARGESKAYGKAG
jgi:two-component system chemotaxis response regulator CheB